METNITCSNPLEQYQSFLGSLVVYQWCPTSLDYSVRGNQQEQSCSMDLLRLGKKNTIQSKWKHRLGFLVTKSFHLNFKKKNENFTESNLVNICMRFRNPTQHLRVSSLVKGITTRNLSSCFHSKITITSHPKHFHELRRKSVLKKLWKKMKQVLNCGN